MSQNQNDDQDSIDEVEVQRVSTSPISPEKKAILPSELSLKTRGILALFIGALIAVGYHYYHSSLRLRAAATKSNLYELDPSQVEKRRILPNYSFKTADSSVYKLSDYHGKVLILSFWASWCSPCLVELPTFSQMQKKFSNQGLMVLAVNVEDNDDGKKFAEDFWKRNKFDFMSFFDTSTELAQSFQVELLPSNFVIDKSGRLVFSGFGSTDWNSPLITDLLEGLLQEPAEEISSRPEIQKKTAAPGINPKNPNGPPAEEDVD